MLEARVDRSYRAAFLLALGSVLLVAFLLLRSSAAPLVGDYAEWTYHGVLLRNVLQGHPDAGYVLKNYPVPNSLTTAGLGVLMLALPWKVAAKLWLIVEALLGLAAAVQLQKASGRPQGWRLLVLPAAMFFGTAFWFGFTNFLFGVSFAMLVCALLLRGVESRWLYGVLLLAAFFSHMIPYGFAVLALGLYALQTGRWRLLWQAAPTLGLCLWYFAGLASHGDVDAHAGMSPSVAYSSPLFAAFKVGTYLKCWGFVNPARNAQDSILLRLAGTNIFVTLFVLCVVVAASVLLLLVAAAWRAWKEKTEQRFFWIATAVFFVVSLVMPGAAAGVSDPGGRMMEVAVWCGLCVVATRRRWTGTLLGTCGVVLLAMDCYLLGAVAMKPPMAGSTAGPLPARVREFAHAYYAGRWWDYGDIEQGKMDADIYPTSLFLKTGK